MSNDKMKTQGDILGVANETMKQLNEMIKDPKQYNLKKISLKKIRTNKNKDKDKEDR